MNNYKKILMNMSQEEIDELIDMPNIEYINGMKHLLHHLQKEILGYDDYVSLEANKYIKRREKDLKKKNYNPNLLPKTILSKEKGLCKNCGLHKASHNRSVLKNMRICKKFEGVKE